MTRERPHSITPGLALLPVRLFLGVTFVYAGYQKLSDPGFLTPGSATYIGTQLHAFAAGTPGGFLLRWFALPFPRAAGVGVALAEIAIGLLAFAGLLTRGAAAAGLSLNLVLFLTASWSTTPYFLGSDIVFCFAWLPLALVGAADQPALDNLIAARRRAAQRAPMRTRAGASVHVAGKEPGGTRGDLLARGVMATGAATLAIAAFAVFTRGRASGARVSAPFRPTRRRARRAYGTQPEPSPSTTTGATTRAPRLPAGAVRLGPSSRLQDGQAAVYRDPADGSPDILVRTGAGSLAAFSAVCTHAGCQVAYQSGVLYCPCHGSEFDANTGAVLRGPAATPLARKRVIERRGSIYAV